MGRSAYHKEAVEMASFAYSKLVDGRKLRGEKKKWTDESNFLLCAHIAALDALFWAEHDCEDECAKEVIEAVVGWSLYPYIEYRMDEPGIKQKMNELRQRLGADATRFSLVREIIEHGVSETKAFEAAAQLLADTDHPAGTKEQDESSIRKSYERFRADEWRLPIEHWTLPGIDKKLMKVPPFDEEWLRENGYL